MSIPSRDELVQIGTNAAGMKGDQRTVDAWKGVTWCSNPDIWAAAQSLCYPGPDDYGTFAAAVRDAVLDALIADAQSDFPTRPFTDYERSTRVLDWLQAHKETT